MPKLTLSMIVKNEEKLIRESLASTKEIVDEIVMVDTGSSDNTVKIAEEYGAKVFNYEWVNDFSAARNFALGKSTGDWIIYLDADERLDNNSVAEIRKLIENNSSAAFYCTVKSDDYEGIRDNSIRYLRLFANSREIRFTGRVNEEVEASLIKNRYQLFNSNVLIHHIGFNISDEETKKRASRNLSILNEEYEKNKSAYYAFYMARSYNLLNAKEQAFKYSKIAGESVGLDRSLRSQCFSSMALTAHHDNKIADAEKYIQFSLKLDDRQPYAQLLASKIASRRGDYLTAEVRCRGAHQLNQNMLFGREQSKLAILLDSEEVIYYGLTLALQNKNATNINYYQKELSTYYNRTESENGITKLIVIQKLFSNAPLNPDEEKMFVDMANRHTMNLFMYLLINNPNKHQVYKLANDLLQKYPEAVEIKKILARLLDEFGKLDEAIQMLESIVEKDQYDSTILFYLISFYLRKGTDWKIKITLTKLEKNYSHLPEIMERVRKLRRKLLMLTNVPI